MMRIAIDGNLLTGKKTGMGTVVFHVLKNWKSDAKTSFILYVREELPDEYAHILYENGIEIKILGNTNYLKWEQIILPKAIQEDKIDVLWAPYNTAPIFLNCKIVVTIHDLIYMTSSLRNTPSLYKKLGIIYRKSIVPIIAKKSKKIITVSNFTKKEIECYFPKQKEKITVVYSNSDNEGKTLSELEKNNFFKCRGIKFSYILGFGSLEPRKNTMGLINAYECLPAEIQLEFQLVLFGFRGYEDSKEYKYIKDRGLNENVILLDYVSEEEKNTLYEESNVFVFPTLSEGFGIPVLEAFANKTPVITSNTTSLPEVTGDAATLVNPQDVTTISNSIYKLLTNEHLCEKHVELGLKQLAKFSWVITAKSILKELIKVVENE